MNEMTNMPGVPQSGFHACFRLGAPEVAARHFVFFGDELLVTEDNALPDVDFQALCGSPDDVLVFGVLDGKPCQLSVWPEKTLLPAGLRRTHYRHLWGRWDGAALEAATRARQLVHWLSANRYCGRCAGALNTCATEPARVCGACGFKAYPGISPVCIGLVRHGERILLARSPHFPPGIYSALAGFMEAGESVEDCLRRELREEAGIEISRPEWFASQAWPYPSTLMMGFFADFAGGELRAQPGEIEDVRWFDKTDLPALPHPSTLAFQMISAWLESQP